MSAAAAALSSNVGAEIWSSPCRPRFGGSRNEFWGCIATSRLWHTQEMTGDDCGNLETVEVLLLHFG